MLVKVVQGRKDNYAKVAAVEFSPESKKTAAK